MLSLVARLVRFALVLALVGWCIATLT